MIIAQCRRLCVGMVSRTLQEYKSAVDSFARKSYSKPEREAMTSLLTSMLDDVADAIAASRYDTAQVTVLLYFQLRTVCRWQNTYNDIVFFAM